MTGINYVLQHTQSELAGRSYWISTDTIWVLMVILILSLGFVFLESSLGVP